MQEIDTFTIAHGFINLTFPLAAKTSLANLASQAIMMAFATVEYIRLYIDTLPIAQNQRLFTAFLAFKTFAFRTIFEI